jgi:hypothetical protein
MGDGQLPIDYTDLYWFWTLSQATIVYSTLPIPPADRLDMLGYGRVGIIRSWVSSGLTLAYGSSGNYLLDNAKRNDDPTILKAYDELFRSTEW